MELGAPPVDASPTPEAAAALSASTPAPEATPTPTADDDTAEDAPTTTADGLPIVATSIAGGLSIKNETDIAVDAAALLQQGPAVTLPAGEPQILIMHTHASEAFTPAGRDLYPASDTCRTEDTNYNIVHVGDVLADTLTAAGLQVLHDRTIYDYPSYTGSYNRSGAAVQAYLSQYPSLRIVIDLHRDALCSDSVVYKTVAELPDAACSQVMLLVGTNASGLYHPYWEENLRLAVYLQDAVNTAHPTLMRPITLVNERYNQHLTRGSLIIEVGSSGNTLQEAMRAVRLFGESAGPALARLVQ
ncbi:MAG: stage II sporulation protein P [Oscillospiraceae bacterium]